MKLQSYGDSFGVTLVETPRKTKYIWHLIGNDFEVCLSHGH